MPDSVYWQWIYLVYRWITFTFFFIYFIWNQVSNGGITYIYLTTWSLNLLTLYLSYAALSVTIYYIRLALPIDRIKRKPINPPSRCALPSKPYGICSYRTNTLAWYDIIHWLLFIIGPGIALASMVLFWGAIYSGGPLSHWDVAIHFLNGVFSFFEIWVTRIPIRVYHALYAVLLGCVYITFSGIYFSAGGKNQQGDPYIYDIIDYGNSPVNATITVMLIVMLFAPVVLFFYYANYLLRETILRSLAFKGVFKWLCKEDKTKFDDSKEIVRT